MLQTTDAMAAPSAIDEDGFPAYPWLPADTVRLTGYDEIVEVLRHAGLVTEPRVVDAPFKQGALNAINGKEHLQRRRTMNRIVRADAIASYREQVLLPSLRAQMREIASRADADGVHRADLVQVTRRSFIPVLAGLVGIEVPTGEAGDRLMEMLAAMRFGADARYELGDSRSITDRALLVKEEFRTTHYEPAASACPVRSPGELASGRVDLMSLMCARADPRWEDEGLRLRETIALMLAFGGTVTMITFAVDDLYRWLAAHPEDKELASDLAFLGRCMMETLRFHPLAPVVRIALEDVTLSSGVVIRKGQWVMGSKLAANRDERVFGADAKSFNPHRELPTGLPRYGLALGAGVHQCIGLGLVLGMTGAGVAADALRVYFAAGVRPDEVRSPRSLGNLKTGFSSYPVVFDRPAVAAGPVSA